ncbi:MAG: hypothetical protein M1133_00090 [Armatimonadetes bacterium]|nr:hypothetical protein [Armatimonadota bacterium]
MRRYVSALSAVLLTLLCVSANAAEVNRDFLLGIGEFTKSTYTVRLGGDVFGDPSLPADTVANGWVRVATSPGLTSDNYIFDLTTTPGYQYIALKNITSNTAALEVFTQIVVDDTNPYCLHTGDTVTFAIERIKMRDWSGISYVDSYMSIVGLGSKKLSYSAIDSSDSITATVPVGASTIKLSVRLYTQGDLGIHTPALLISGAHLYVTRAGSRSHEMEYVPAVRNRNIATNNVGWHPNYNNVRSTARDYDEISTNGWVYPSFSAMRKLNPNMRIYLYQTGMAIHDISPEWNPRWSQSPQSFSEVLSGHPNWLIPGIPGIPNGYKNEHGYLNLNGYADKYAVSVVTASEYQTNWVQTVIAKAKTLGVDGVWIDDCGTLVPEHDAAVRQPWEVQQFLHAVIPKLKQAGLPVVINQAEANLDGSLSWNQNPPLVYLSPFWTPDSTYPASAGYSPNTVDNTPDVFFREYSFIRWNSRYDSAYWLKCLNDPAIIADWNSRLPASSNRRLQYSVCSDNEINSAYGADGWVQFALASYLLCQNSYTSFGAHLGEKSGFKYPTIDYSITKRLGAPDGDHQPYNGDAYLRYRRYKSTADGGVGGVVVVNGNTDSSRNYTLDFDAIDESGNRIATGTVITLMPHTARIFLQRTDSVDIKITAPTQGVSPGQVITVVLDYTNKSASEAKNVQLRARVPDELTYVSGSAEQSGGYFDSETNTVCWVAATVGAGETGSRQFKARVN